jgi:hypothetical protein
MKELYNKLVSSNEFKNWKVKHKESFLCSYIMIENPQFDFYNKNDTLTSFIMNDEIETKDNEEFLKSHSKLKELKLDEVRVSQDEALELIKERNEYSRKLIILQNTKEPFWNITLISPSKLLNIKIDAKNKKILSKKIEPISKLMRKVV